MNRSLQMTAVVALLGCSEAPATDAFKVSDGILVVDATALRANGIDMSAGDGQSLNGIVEVRPGLTVTGTREKMTKIGSSSLDLAVFDLNNDQRIDEGDASWKAMYLAVDYNRDGEIGEGEFALIGECGVDAISVEVSAEATAWSIHRGGEKKAVTLEQQTQESS